MEAVVTAVVAAMPMHESLAPACTSSNPAAAAPDSAITLELRATPKVVIAHYAKVITIHLSL